MENGQIFSYNRAIIGKKIENRRNGTAMEILLLSVIPCDATNSRSWEGGGERKCTRPERTLHRNFNTTRTTICLVRDTGVPVERDHGRSTVYRTIPSTKSKLKIGN